MEDFQREVRNDVLAKLTVEERLAGLSAKERLAGISAKDLAGLSPEEREKLLEALLVLKGNAAPTGEND